MKNFLRLKSDTVVVVESKIYDKHGNNPLVWIGMEKKKKIIKILRIIGAKLDFHYTLTKKKRERNLFYGMRSSHNEFKKEFSSLSIRHLSWYIS